MSMIDMGDFWKKIEDAYERDGWNLYAYCQNNPIVYYDPSGYMGQTNDGKCGTPKTSEGETKFTADKFPNGFPRPDISTNAKLKAYKELLKAKIGKKLDNNDIVLGVEEAKYRMFDVNSSNPDRNNILDNHINRMKKLGYHYSYWVKDIDILYNMSVGKIYFMVDGMQPREEFNEYLRGNKPTEEGLSVTNIELAAVFGRSDNLKKTTFCFRGEPIPFSVVKEVLKLPDLPTFHL